MLTRYRRPLRNDVLLVLAAALGWMLWGWVITWLRYRAQTSELSLWSWGSWPSWARHDLEMIVVWSWLASICGVFILYMVDFFRPYRTFKFGTDFFLFLLAFPCAGLFAKPVILLVFENEFLRSREILLGGVVPALAGALMEMFELWNTSSMPVKSTVYLALTDGEKDRFVETILSRGWERYYRFLTFEEFNGALVTGGRVDAVIMSRSATQDFLQHQGIIRAHMAGVNIQDYHTVMAHILGHINMNDTDMWTFLAGSETQGVFDLFYRAIRFYLEPLVAGVLLMALSPLFLITALVIRFTSPGPVFFRQKRSGYLGVEFDLIKFRTMRVDAESSGPMWATKQDRRVTPVGAFLRKTRLDELPQLWNVVRGEISFMGPRPERPEFYEIIEKQVPHFKLRLLMRPGITGWAQLLGGYAASIEESARKLEYDLYYLRYMSPRLDLLILGKTLLLLVRGNSGR